jgi:sulfatase maturation enzyme AslB (radical SAM superfamily)
LVFDLTKNDRDNPIDHLSHRYGLTTNAPLLDKSCIDFFIEDDFSLLVSLDEPTAVHDRFRRFKNGRETFKPIMENLFNPTNV